MTCIRVKGFQIFNDRHGRQRCYHRATRLKIDLGLNPIGSAGFFAECEKIATVQRAKSEIKPRPGTLGGLVAHYFSHDHFVNLSATTQRDYRWCANFIKSMSALPVSELDTPMISGIHNKATEKHGWR